MSAPGLPQPSPQAAPQGQPQPSAGASPVTQPVPNQGHQAAGMAKLAMIVRLMEQTIPMLGAGSEAGRDLLQATSRLAKHVSSGSVSQGSENTAVQNLVAQQRQMQPVIAQMNAANQPQASAQPQPAAAA